MSLMLRRILLVSLLCRDEEAHNDPVESRSWTASGAFILGRDIDSTDPILAVYIPACLERDYHNAHR